MEQRLKDFLNLILDFGDEWVVTKIESDHRLKHVYIYVEYKSDYYEDPVNMEPAKLYDHCSLREWRHLDIWDYKSYIRCRIPRVLCKDGKVRQIAIGWTDSHDRHTCHFEMRVIDLLKITKNQSKTAQYLDCGFRLVNRIIHRCTERGLIRRDQKYLSLEHISIDEKSFHKGHKYVTVLSHPVSGVVLDVAEGRDTRATIELLQNCLTRQQRQNVCSVSVDMWKAYQNAIEDQLPNAEIVHDKFHLVKYLNESIDKVRRREAIDQDILKHGRYALLKNEENLTAKQKEKFEQIKNSNLEVTNVWHIRENFKSLFGLSNNDSDAKSLLMTWVKDSIKYGIKEVNKVIDMFISHIKGVVNALISTFNNAMAERLNGKIQEIKLCGRGYRTFKNFRSAILFFHGGLDLYPLKW
jgi:transposase